MNNFTVYEAEVRDSDKKIKSLCEFIFVALFRAKNN